jgi:lipopolysaccharide biosynthesis glycosyltransferase
VNKGPTTGTRVPSLIGCDGPVASMSNSGGPIIHVACALDGRVLVAARALAASLACQARPDRPIVLHVLHSGLAARITDALAGCQQRALSVCLHDLGGAFTQLPVKRPFSIAIYYRLCLPSLLKSLSRIIYLDADTLVLRDLAPLFDLPLNDFPVAAMPDYALYYFELMSAIPIGNRRAPVISYLRNILGIEYRGPASYFNSGVMLLNLDAWRGLDIAARCVAFIERFDYLQWPDQDALNVTCGQRFLALGARWNAFARWCQTPSPFGSSDALTSLQNDWVHDPWIVHFSGDCKPWRMDHFRTVHDHLFWRYLNNASLRGGREISSPTNGNPER